MTKHAYPSVSHNTSETGWREMHHEAREGSREEQPKAAQDSTQQNK